jgi:hypothetical protein
LRARLRIAAASRWHRFSCAKCFPPQIRPISPRTPLPRPPEINHMASKVTRPVIRPSFFAFW